MVRWDGTYGFTGGVVFDAIRAADTGKGNDKRENEQKPILRLNPLCQPTTFLFVAFVLRVQRTDNNKSGLGALVDDGGDHALSD